MHDPHVSEHPGTSEEISVRAARSEHADQIRALALDNAMFAADEMDGFDEGLHGYLENPSGAQRWIVALDRSERVVGAALYAPEPFGDRVWNLLFLAAEPAQQRRGIGATLVAHVESELRAAGGHVARVLIVETSSTDQFVAARRFYERRGFDREAVIREYYGPGDDKVTYWKDLTA